MTMNILNNIDWQEDLEWELVDSKSDMILGDTFLIEQKRLREERQKVEEADHKLTEELFSASIVNDNPIIRENIIKSLKYTGNNVVKKNKKIR